MTSIPKKIVVNEQGDPVEVIIPWAAFCEISETFGWDLDENAKADLSETLADVQTNRWDAFLPLS